MMFQWNKSRWSIINPKKKLINIEKEHKTLNDSYNDLAKEMEKKFESFENKIELLRKTLEDKETKISTLETKLETIEDTLGGKLTILEKQMKTKETKFKCENCKFETNSETGLKKVIEIDDNGFPKQCSLCDNILANSKDMKKHMRTHSYKDAVYKYDLCEFIGGDEIEMEVHLAKLHGESFECGLCTYNAKDLETLDTHLRFCN